MKQEGSLLGITYNTHQDERITKEEMYIMLLPYYTQNQADVVSVPL